MAPRILLAGGGTGGHLVPALNLARALEALEPGVELLYVGAERGLEARVLPDRGLPHHLLPMLPIHRSRPWRNARWLIRAGPVALGLRRIYHRFDPCLVVGTGGYASGPPLLYGRLTGRATALQEQNARPGLVTRWMARHVDQVHLGFPEAAAELGVGPGTRVLAHGNPVRLPGSASRHPAFGGEERIVLVVGGSQGASGLNRRLLDDLRAAGGWPADVRLVWIAGEAHADALRDRVEELPAADRIRVLPYVEELAGQLDRVSLAVSRAGAMLVSELAAAGVPSVLVPFPGAAGGHQRENARRMSEAGAALMHREGALAPGQLWGSVVELLEDESRRRRMARAARERGQPDAAERIAGDLLALASGTRTAGAGGGPDDG